MMEAEISGDVEAEDEEGVLGLEDIPEVDEHIVFARYHNSTVGYLGAERTLKALSLVMDSLACVGILFG